MMKLSLLATLSFLLTSNVFAQDAKTWRLSVGAGMAFKKNLRVGNTYEDMDKSTISKSIPFVQGGYGRVSIGAQGLSVMAFGNQMMNVSAFINKGGDRYHGLGMIPRKDSFFTGVSAKYFKYGLSVARDINGRSKGFASQLSYSEMFILSEKFILRGSLTLEWFDDRYAEYYYGVRSFEATSTRPEYHLNNYFQPGIGVMPIYKVTETMSLITGVNFKMVPKDVKRSPTMNGDNIEVGALVGISYAL